MKLCKGVCPFIPSPFHHIYANIPHTGGHIASDNNLNDSDLDDE